MTRSWKMLCLAAAIGCAPTASKEAPRTTSAATLALFEPNSSDACASVLPYPTDLAKDPQTGKLNVPYCKTDTADQIGMKTGLRTLDGWSMGVTMTAQFSGAIKPESAADAVKVFEVVTSPLPGFKPATVSTAFVAANNNTLYITPQDVLREHTTYMVVITTGLLDAAGQPVASDQIFTFAKSAEPLIDDMKHSRFKVLDDASANALEPLRLGFKPMFDGLEKAGLGRDAVALAWGFTTQTAAAQLPQIWQLKGGVAVVTHENSIPAAQHALVTAALAEPMRDQLCDVHTGRVELKSLLGETCTFRPDLATTKVMADFILITPNVDDGEETAKCTTPWDGTKVALFAHGLGRCKNDVLALANAFAKQGIAVLAVDGPRAGARSVVDRGDQDLDGCPDQPATPELIALPNQSPNPFAIRDHLRQWSFELAQVATAAHQIPLAFVGKTDAATAKVALVGHSWGGMAGALASLIAPVDAVVLNAASADLGGVFAPLLKAQGMGDDIVAVFRWAMEAGDPLFAGPMWALTSKPPVLVQVLEQPGQNQPPLHFTATQQLLAKAFGTTSFAATFRMNDETGGQDAPLCATPTGVVGAMLKPCADATDSTRYLQAVGKLMGIQRQVVVFAKSAMAGITPIVCNNDPTVACP